MSEELPKILAQIHADFGIYHPKIFNAAKDKNIIYQISTIPELAYLHQFYVDYQNEYLTELQRRPNQHFAQNVTNVSTSIDLPFVGNTVIETGKAKYFFVLEGSLASPDYLTVAFHSCFWPLGSDWHQFPTYIQSLMGNGKGKYRYRYECLGISPKIIRDLYLIDAIRIGTSDGKKDYKQNRELLKREIEQLNPELVVLAGKEAAKIIGNEADSNPLYFKVTFPTWQLKSDVKEKANKEYEELHRRLLINKFVLSDQLI